MSQFEAKPKAIRDQIRRLLHDSYRGGFPILKELVQNADDAGAQRLHVTLLADGMQDVDHPLFNGPALLAVNDAPFSPRDEDGIKTLGDSPKESNERVIGKFGLGMKAVFHLCDAFFWLASSWASGDKPPRRDQELINPWEDLPSHADWCEPTVAHWQAARATAAIVSNEIVDDGTWFCLWLPLRSPSLVADGRGHFGRNDATERLQELLAVQNGSRLAAALPLLRSLQEIRVSGNPSSYQLERNPVGKARLDVSQVDMRIVLADADQRREMVAQGTVASSPELSRRFPKREGWPQSEDESGRLAPVRAKAEGAALLINRSPDKTPAAVDIQPAIYLPLDEGQEGNHVADVSLVLHGEFFVDAGRRALVLDHAGGLESEWNNAILDEVVLPQIPGAIVAHAEAVTDNSTRDSFIEAIVGRLCRVDDLCPGGRFVEQRRASICRQYQLVPRLGEGWQLVEGTQPVYEIPCAWNRSSSVAALSEKLGQALPGFDSASDCWLLVPQNAPILSSQKPLAPTSELAKQLLGKPDELAARFLDRPAGAALSLLKTLKGHDTESLLGYVRAIIAAWASRPRKEQSGEVEAVTKEAIRLLPADRVLFVPDELPSYILRHEVPAVLVPQRLAGDLKPVGRLDAASSEALLRQAMRQRLQPRKLSELAKAVVEATDDPGGDLEQLAVFRSQRADEQDVMLSLRELRMASDCNRLFTSGSEWGQDVAAATGLPVVVCHDVPLVEKIQDVRCDRATASRLVIDTDEVAAPRCREPLVKRLARGTNPPTEDTRRALRKLLAGRVADDEDTLLVSADGANLWLDVLLAFEASTGESSAFVDTTLVDALSRSQQQDLGIRPAETGAVLARLGRSIQQCTDMIALPPDIAERAFEALGTLHVDGLVETHGDALRHLPIHRTHDGRYVACNDNTFVSANGLGLDGLPDAVTRNVQLLVPHGHEVGRLVQRHLVGDFDATTAVRLLLDVEEQAEKVSTPPNTILSLLEAAGDEVCDADRDRLAKLKWLPTPTGLIAPQDVLALPVSGQKWTDQQEVSEVDLSDEVRKRVRGIGWLLPDRDESLRRLGDSAGRIDRYRVGIGISGEEEEFGLPLALWRKVCEHSSGLMPVVELIQEICDAKWPGGVKGESLIPLLLPSLATPIEDPDRVVGILRHVAAETEEAVGADKEDRRQLFQAYLRQAVVHETWRKAILPRLRLPTRADTWTEADQLCARTPGASGDHVLCPRALDVLKRHITEDHDAPRAEDDKDADLPDPATAAADLRTYLGSLPAPPGAKGGLLALLGDDPGVQGLARELLAPRSLENVRAEVPWTIVSGSNTVGADKSLAELSENVRVAVTVKPPNEMIVTVNLLGEPLHVPPSARLETLLLGKLDSFRPTGGAHQGRLCWHLPLRRLSRPEQQSLTSIKAAAILQQTAVEIINRIYWRWDVDLSDLWQGLGEADQLDVDIARDGILNHVDGHLRRLSTDRLPRFRPELSKLDEAREREVEAKHARANGKALEREAQLAAERAIGAISELLQYDEEAQAEVLDALRAKVIENGYDPCAIATELFQNADDAVAELAEIVAYNSRNADAPAPLPPDLFVAHRDAARGYQFVHWGRPINKFRQGNFDGRDRGFARDLRKMLSLNESDKLLTAELSVGGETAGARTTTGRFGLGFKSVFLVSDRPRVLSGWLGFEVRGGLLPVRLEGDATEQLRNAAARFWRKADERKSSDAPPTLVDLQLRDDEELGDLLDDFERLAPALVVFAKRLRRVLLDNSGRSSLIAWEPQCLLSVDGVEIGHFSGPTPKRRSADAPTPEGAMFFGGDGREGILVGLGPDGPTAFVDLPDVWVTAPTSRLLGSGFAINGPFAIDPGRTQLHVASPDNAKVAERIARRFGRQLLDLFDAAESDWPATRKRLGLRPDVPASMFWARLFNRLTPNLPDGPEADIVRSVLTGFGTLLQARASVPVDFDSEPVLMKLPDIQAVLVGKLATDSALRRELTTWPSWTTLTSNRWITADVRERLRRLDLEPNAEDVRFSDFVTHELRDKVEPEAASRVGALLLPLLRTPQGEVGRHQGVSDTERKDLTAALQNSQFRADNGEWRDVGDLLLPPSADDAEDEKARAQFAPRGSVLAGEYDADGIALFRYVRSLMPAPRIGPEAMAEWVLSAENEKARAAALRYLANGEEAQNLARKLVNHDRFERSWLAELNRSSDTLSTAVLDKGDQLRVLANLGLLSEHVISPEDMEWPNVPEAPRLPDPGDFLRALADAWRLEGQALTVAYEDRIYGGTPLPIDLDYLTKQDMRQAIMELFVLGALHTTPFGNIGSWGSFVSRCRAKGWIETFAGNPPDASAWMRVLEEYVREDSGPHYKLEMQRFPEIYQLALHLDDYAAALREAAKLDAPSKTDLFDPRRSAALSGSGVGDAPSLERAAGRGRHFIIRELVRKGVLENSALHPHCYVPLKRIRVLVGRWACTSEEAVDSGFIHTFLAEHLDDATFDGAFDIPLLAAAEGRIGGLDDAVREYIDKRAADEEAAELAAAAKEA